MPSEMTLPSAESIRNNNPDKLAIQQNMTLMDYNDALSGSEDEMEDRKVQMTASI